MDRQYLGEKSPTRWMAGW